MSRSFGPYQIESLISQGGMGAVHRAVLADGRRVALKTILPGRANAQGTLRFEREIRAMRRLDHDNVIRILDHGELQGVMYYAMELIEGEDLESYVTKSLRNDGAVPDFDWIRELFCQLAEALEFCHENGLSHRDLKPSNILIEKGTGRPVIVDFGLAKLESNELTQASIQSLTRTGETLGTPAYMAPEQLIAKDELGEMGPHTDVWGLGATLYFALTGRSPFESDNVDIFIALASHDVSTWPRDINAEVPKELDKVCRRALVRDQSKRPEMSQLAAWLEESTPRQVRLPLIAAVSIFLLIGIVSAYVSLRAELKLLEFQAPTAVRDSAKVTGRLAAANVILIEGKKGFRERISTGPDGRFSLEIPLPEEGAQPFELRFEGQSQAIRQFSIIRDNTAPVLELDGTGVRVLDSGDPALTGKVSDALPVTLEVDGREIQVEASGRFRARIFDAQHGEHLLKVTDAAGNLTETKVRVISKDALAAADATLKDFREWQTTPDWLQDLVIQRVEQRLGPDFRHSYTQRYSSGGQAHRIATFYHLRTGMALNLIPGGTSVRGTKSRGEELKFCRSADPTFREETLERDGPYGSTELGEAFLIARFEIRLREWRRITDRLSGDGEGDFPIHALTRAEIDTWLAAAGSGLRLPTEDEWNHACRAGTETRYSWGPGADDRDFWYASNTRNSQPRSVLDHAQRSNAFGLVDMLGNVAEYVQDGANSEFDKPMLRGGSSRDSVANTRCASRAPYNALNPYGASFRVACSLPPARD